jgi:hypothetical protein
MTPFQHVRYAIVYFYMRILSFRTVSPKWLFVVRFRLGHLRYSSIPSKMGKHIRIATNPFGKGAVLTYDIQLHMQSVLITTDIVSSNLNQGEVYNIV